MNKLLLMFCAIYTVLISTFFILLIERQWEWHFKTLKAHSTMSLSDKDPPQTVLQQPQPQDTNICIERKRS